MSKTPGDINTRTSIYVLKDPRNDNIRYVGKTFQKLNKRLLQHICDAKAGQQRHVCYWINSLIKLKLKPLIVEVDNCESSDGIFWEQYYISLFKSWNLNLCNHTGGGEGGLGYTKSIETRAKLSKTKLINSKPVYQYDLDGNFITSWIHIKAAICGTKLIYGSVWKCCNGKAKSHGGFMWSFNRVSKLPAWTIKDYTWSKQSLKTIRNIAKKKVKFRSLNGRVIVFNSAGKTAKFLKKSISFVSATCLKKRKIKENYSLKYL